MSYSAIAASSPTSGTERERSRSEHTRKQKLCGPGPQDNRPRPSSTARLMATESCRHTKRSCNDPLRATIFHNRGTVKPMNLSDSVGAIFAQMAVSSYHHVFPVNRKNRGLEETLHADLQGAEEDNFRGCRQ